MIHYFYQILSLFILWPLIAAAELRDPTRPDYPVSIIKPETQATVPNRLKLSAILITREAAYATINGITGKQGNTVLNSVSILKVLDNAVVIKHQGKVKTLYLLNQTFKPQRIE